MADYLTSTDTAAFVAEDAAGRLVGFLEAGIRPYADGCDTRNVGYVEGWQVEEAHRRQGIGAALVRVAEDWARGKGCQEMASDCLLDNQVSRAGARGLGIRGSGAAHSFRQAFGAPRGRIGNPGRARGNGLSRRAFRGPSWPATASGCILARRSPALAS